MASLAIPNLTAPASMEQWITPQEQLQRLALVTAEERLYANKAKFEMVPDTLANTVTEVAARSILRRSNLLPPSNEVPALTDLVVEHLIEPTPLPPILTNWYTALDRLNATPEKIPPLPR